MPKTKTINFALLGLGKLGSGFYTICQQKKDKIRQETGFQLNLKKILVKNSHFRRAHNIDSSLITTNIQDIADDDSIHVVIDAIGGIEPTFSIIKTLIAAGKDIISANRILLASKMEELAQMANKHNVYILPEPSLGGGLPIVSALKRDLVANQIKSIYGIVSGTSNFILSEMTRHEVPLKKVLRSRKMQQLAESLSIIDYEGSDAAQKVSILAASALGVNIDYYSIYSEGISDISVFDIQCAKEFGYEFKLLAIMKDHGNTLEIRVHPTLVPIDHPLTLIRDEYNAFFVQTDLLGDYMAYGRGLGVEPTSSLILRDLILVGELQRQRGSRHISYRLDWNPKPVMPIEDIVTAYYLRFPCVDKPGVVGKITTVLGENGINIGSAHAEVNKKDENGLGYVHILIDEAREGDIRQALNNIKQLDIMRGKVKLFRIM